MYVTSEARCARSPAPAAAYRDASPSSSARPSSVRIRPCNSRSRSVSVFFIRGLLAGGRAAGQRVRLGLAGDAGPDQGVVAGRGPLHRVPLGLLADDVQG